MFDRMQYIFNLPLEQKKMEKWNSQILGNNGEILGSVTRLAVFFHQFSPKTAQLWFEDTNGTRLIEMRSDKVHRITNFAIYDQTNEQHGIISRDVKTGRWAYNYGGTFLLFDSERKQIARSDSVSYVAMGNRFEELRKKNVNIWSSDGSRIGIIHAAMSSLGCQVDIYPSNVSQLQVLSLVASIMFL
jgi:hypothetical protein